MLKKGMSSQILFNGSNEKVILLVHGFRSIPKIFEEFANVLYQEGFSVYNLRLPGHGLENEEEIYKVNLRDWETIVENVFLDLSDNFKKVYCCGISMGASLLLQLSKKYLMDKMIIISPLMRIRQKRIYLSWIMKHFIKKIDVKKVDCTIDNESFKYFIPFLPMAQSYEVLKLTLKIRKNIKNISAKGLCFFSPDDHDMNYIDNKKIVEKTEFKIIDLNKSRHQSIVDIEKDIIINKSLEWLKNN